MATYPPRYQQMLDVASIIAPQVDTLSICANEYDSLEAFRHMPENVIVRLPAFDLKDMGKFLFSADPDDLVLLVDDDIIYPEDYAVQMEAHLIKFGRQPTVVGVHGTVYSDFYDGSLESRLVHSFRRSLSPARVVNQLGTGTVACWGAQLPGLDYMQSSSKFVDVRFARFCFENGIRQVCVERREAWLSPLETDETLFETFTQHWPDEVLREVNRFGGFRRLSSIYP